MNLYYLAPADRPVIEGLEAHEVVFAEHQSEYVPLRALVSTDHGRRAMSRWTLTPEQRQAIADGADLFLTLFTFGQPMQPITLAVSHEPATEAVRTEFGLREFPTNERPGPRVGPKPATDHPVA